MESKPQKLRPDLVVTTAPDQVVDSFDTTEYRSAFYRIQVSAGANFQTTTISVLHDDTNVYITEVNTMITSITLAEFSADLTNGMVRLLVSPSIANITVKTVSVLLAV